MTECSTGATAPLVDIVDSDGIRFTNLDPLIMDERLRVSVLTAAKVRAMGIPINILWRSAITHRSATGIERVTARTVCFFDLNTVDTADTDIDAVISSPAIYGPPVISIDGISSRAVRLPLFPATQESYSVNYKATFDTIANVFSIMATQIPVLHPGREVRRCCFELTGYKKLAIEFNNVNITIQVNPPYIMGARECCWVTSYPSAFSSSIIGGSMIVSL